MKPNRKHPSDSDEVPGLVLHKPSLRLGKTKVLGDIINIFVATP